MKNLEDKTTNERITERIKKGDYTPLQNIRAAISNGLKVASYGLCYGGLAGVPLYILAMPFYIENHESLALSMPVISGFVLPPIGTVAGILAEAIGLPGQHGHGDAAPWNVVPDPSVIY